MHLLNCSLQACQLSHTSSGVLRESDNTASQRVAEAVCNAAERQSTLQLASKQADAGLGSVTGSEASKDALLGFPGESVSQPCTSLSADAISSARLDPPSIAGKRTDSPFPQPAVFLVLSSFLSWLLFYSTVCKG